MNSNEIPRNAMNNVDDVNSSGDKINSQIEFFKSAIENDQFIYIDETPRNAMNTFYEHQKNPRHTMEYIFFEKQGKYRLILQSILTYFTISSHIANLRRSQKQNFEYRLLAQLFLTLIIIIHRLL